MRYIRDNLLNSDRSIAHCVSEDFVMGAGIARTISDRYDRGKLCKADLHNIGWMWVGNRYILYIVTKRKFWMKPTLEDMKLGLINLRRWCLGHHIDKLAIPRLGCGLDRLNWEDVEKLIAQELEEYGIDIDVYYL